MKPRLSLPLKAFDALMAEATAAKAGGVVRVPRDTLVALLMDHSAVLAALGPKGYEEAAPPNLRITPKGKEAPKP